jgi:hypothetical protein
MSDLEVVMVEFQKQLVLFIDELIGQFSNLPELVIFRIFIKNQIPIQDMIEIFHYNINKDDKILKKMVKERNEGFFLDNDPFDFSKGDTKNTINHFKTIWRSPNIDSEDKSLIWNWVDSFIYLSDKYNKCLMAQS